MTQENITLRYNDDGSISLVDAATGQPITQGATGAEIVITREEGGDFADVNTVSFEGNNLGHWAYWFEHDTGNAANFANLAGAIASIEDPVARAEAAAAFVQMAREKGDPYALMAEQLAPTIVSNPKIVLNPEFNRAIEDGLWSWNHNRNDAWLTPWDAVMFRAQERMGESFNTPLTADSNVTYGQQLFGYVNTIQGNYQTSISLLNLPAATPLPFETEPAAEVVEVTPLPEYVPTPTEVTVYITNDQPPLVLERRGDDYIIVAEVNQDGQVILRSPEGLWTRDGVEGGDRFMITHFSVPDDRGLAATDWVLAGAEALVSGETPEAMAQTGNPTLFDPYNWRSPSDEAVPSVSDFIAPVPVQAETETAVVDATATEPAVAPVATQEAATEVEPAAVEVQEAPMTVVEPEPEQPVDVQYAMSYVNGEVVITDLATGQVVTNAVSGDWGGIAGSDARAEGQGQTLGTYVGYMSGDDRSTEEDFVNIVSAIAAIEDPVARAQATAEFVQLAQTKGEPYASLAVEIAPTLLNDPDTFLEPTFLACFKTTLEEWPDNTAISSVFWDGFLTNVDELKGIGAVLDDGSQAVRAFQAERVATIRENAELQPVSAETLAPFVLQDGMSVSIVDGVVTMTPADGGGVTVFALPAGMTAVEFQALMANSAAATAAYSQATVNGDVMAFETLMGQSASVVQANNAQQATYESNLSAAVNIFLDPDGLGTAQSAALEQVQSLQGKLNDFGAAIDGSRTAGVVNANHLIWESIASIDSMEDVARLNEATGQNFQSPVEARLWLIEQAEGLSMSLDAGLGGAFTDSVLATQDSYRLLGPYVALTGDYQSVEFWRYQGWEAPHTTVVIDGVEYLVREEVTESGTTRYAVGTVTRDENGEPVVALFDSSPEGVAARDAAQLIVDTQDQASFVSFDFVQPRDTIEAMTTIAAFDAVRDGYITDENRARFSEGLEFTAQSGGISAMTLPMVEWLSANQNTPPYDEIYGNFERLANGDFSPYGSFEEAYEVYSAQLNVAYFTANRDNPEVYFSPAFYYRVADDAQFLIDNQIVDYGYGLIPATDRMPEGVPTYTQADIEAMRADGMTEAQIFSMFAALPENFDSLSPDEQAAAIQRYREGVDAYVLLTGIQPTALLSGFSADADTGADVVAEAALDGMANAQASQSGMVVTEPLDTGLNQDSRSVRIMDIDEYRIYVGDEVFFAQIATGAPAVVRQMAADSLEIQGDYLQWVGENTEQVAEVVIPAQGGEPGSQYTVSVQERDGQLNVVVAYDLNPNDEFPAIETTYPLPLGTTPEQAMAIVAEFQDNTGMAATAYAGNGIVVDGIVLSPDMGGVAHVVEGQVQSADRDSYVIHGQNVMEAYLNLMRGDASAWNEIASDAATAGLFEIGGGITGRQAADMLDAVRDGLRDELYQQIEAYRAEHGDDSLPDPSGCFDEDGNFDVAAYNQLCSENQKIILDQQMAPYSEAIGQLVSFLDPTMTDEITPENVLLLATMAGEHFTAEDWATLGDMLPEIPEGADPQDPLVIAHGIVDAMQHKDEYMQDYYNQYSLAHGMGLAEPVTEEAIAEWIAANPVAGVVMPEDPFAAYNERVLAYQRGDISEADMLVATETFVEHEVVVLTAQGADEAITVETGLQSTVVEDAREAVSAFFDLYENVTLRREQLGAELVLAETVDVASTVENYRAFYREQLVASGASEGVLAAFDALPDSVLFEDGFVDGFNEEHGVALLLPTDTEFDAIEVTLEENPAALDGMSLRYMVPVDGVVYPPEALVVQGDVTIVDRTLLPADHPDYISAESIVAFQGRIDDEMLMKIARGEATQDEVLTMLLFSGESVTPEFAVQVMGWLDVPESQQVVVVNLLESGALIDREMSLLQTGAEVTAMNVVQGWLTGNDLPVFETPEQAVRFTAEMNFIRDYNAQYDPDITRMSDLIGNTNPPNSAENPYGWEQYASDLAAAEAEVVAEMNAGVILELYMQHPEMREAIAAMYPDVVWPAPGDGSLAASQTAIDGILAADAASPERDTLVNAASLYDQAVVGGFVPVDVSFASLQVEAVREYQYEGTVRDYVEVAIEEAPLEAEAQAAVEESVAIIQGFEGLDMAVANAFIQDLTDGQPGIDPETSQAFFANVFASGIDPETGDLLRDADGKTIFERVVDGYDLPPEQERMILLMQRTYEGLPPPPSTERQEFLDDLYGVEGSEPGLLPLILSGQPVDFQDPDIRAQVLAVFPEMIREMEPGDMQSVLSMMGVQSPDELQAYLGLDPNDPNSALLAEVLFYSDGLNEANQEWVASFIEGIRIENMTDLGFVVERINGEDYVVGRYDEAGVYTALPAPEVYQDGIHGAQVEPRITYPEIELDGLVLVARDLVWNTGGTNGQPPTETERDARAAEIVYGGMVTTQGFELRETEAGLVVTGQRMEDGTIVPVEPFVAYDPALHGGRGGLADALAGVPDSVRPVLQDILYNGLVSSDPMIVSMTSDLLAGQSLEELARDPQALVSYLHDYIQLLPPEERAQLQAQLFGNQQSMGALPLMIAEMTGESLVTPQGYQIERREDGFYVVGQVDAEGNVTPLTEAVVYNPDVHGQMPPNVTDLFTVIGQDALFGDDPELYNNFNALLASVGEGETLDLASGMTLVADWLGNSATPEQLQQNAAYISQLVTADMDPTTAAAFQPILTDILIQAPYLSDEELARFGQIDFANMSLTDVVAVLDETYIREAALEFGELPEPGTMNWASTDPAVIAANEEALAQANELAERPYYQEAVLQPVYVDAYVQQYVAQAQAEGRTPPQEEIDGVRGQLSAMPFGALTDPQFMTTYGFSAPTEQQLAAAGVVMPPITAENYTAFYADAEAATIAETERRLAMVSDSVQAAINNEGIGDMLMSPLGQILFGFVVAFLGEDFARSIMGMFGMELPEGALDAVGYAQNLANTSAEEIVANPERPLLDPEAPAVESLVPEQETAAPEVASGETAASEDSEVPATGDVPVEESSVVVEPAVATETGDVPVEDGDSVVVAGESAAPLGDNNADASSDSANAQASADAPADEPLSEVTASGEMPDVIVTTTGYVLEEGPDGTLYVAGQYDASGAFIEFAEGTRFDSLPEGERGEVRYYNNITVADGVSTLSDEMKYSVSLYAAVQDATGASPGGLVLNSGEGIVVGTPLDASGTPVVANQASDTVLNATDQPDLAPVATGTDPLAIQEDSEASEASASGDDSVASASGASYVTFDVAQSWQAYAGATDDATRAELQESLYSDIAGIGYSFADADPLSQAAYVVFSVDPALVPDRDAMMTYLVEHPQDPMPQTQAGWDAYWQAAGASPEFIAAFNASVSGDGLVKPVALFMPSVGAAQPEVGASNLDPATPPFGTIESGVFDFWPNYVNAVEEDDRLAAQEGMRSCLVATGLAFDIATRESQAIYVLMSVNPAVVAGRDEMVAYYVENTPDPLPASREEWESYWREAGASQEFIDSFCASVVGSGFVEPAVVFVPSEGVAMSVSMSDRDLSPEGLAQEGGHRIGSVEMEGVTLEGAEAPVLTYNVTYVDFVAEGNVEGDPLDRGRAEVNSLITLGALLNAIDMSGVEDPEALFSELVGLHDERIDVQDLPDSVRDNLAAAGIEISISDDGRSYILTYPASGISIDLRTVEAENLDMFRGGVLELMGRYDFFTANESVAQAAESYILDTLGLDVDYTQRDFTENAGYGNMEGEVTETVPTTSRYELFPGISQSAWVQLDSVIGALTLADSDFVLEDVGMGALGILTPDTISVGGLSQSMGMGGIS